MFDHCWRQQHHLRSAVVLFNSGSLRLYTGCKAPQLCRTQAGAPLWRHHCFCLRKVCILLWKDFDAVKEEHGETSDWLLPNCRFWWSEVTAQIPQLYFENFTEHRLESLVEPSETEEETVLLLRTSFPPFVRLESTQVMATKPADGRRAFYGCDHCRDISFYDEYVFPVTCERTGIPMVWDPGGFIITNHLKAGGSRRSQNPSFLLEEAGGQFSSSRQKPFVTPLYLLLVVAPEPAMLSAHCIQYFFAFNILFLF